MPVPRIAIVGRPNVGKSSLLNMVARDKVSIVDPTAGTTRDRVSILAELIPPDEGEDSPRARTVELTDTGGFGVYVAEGGRYNEVGADLASLTDDIEFQIAQAVAGADIVLFVIDTQKGVTPQDEHVARLLRERVLGVRGPEALKRRGAKARSSRAKGSAGGADGSAQGEDAAPVSDDEAERPPLPMPTHEVRVIVVANKCDGPKWEAHAVEAANLGFGEPLLVSAKSNYFRRDFLDGLYRAVSELPGVSEAGHEHDGVPDPEMKIAIIGKRNAGKSSLVNRLAGEKRVIVSEIAGTTRDAVDVRFQMDGRTFIAIDTAGLRRKKSFQDSIEHFAFDRVQRSIDRCDVVVLLIDATEPISQVDQQLAMLVQKSYKPVALVVNKWDAVEDRTASSGKFRGKPITPDKYEEYLRREFKGLEFAPISFISAQAGSNIRPTVDLALELCEQSRQRMATGRINRLLKQILATRGPSSKLGTFAKAYFISQVATRPPTIVLVVNKPELFTPNYKRFLLNRIRETAPFSEVPIKLIVKERKRARIEDLLAGEAQRLREKGASIVGEDLGAEVAAVARDTGDDAAAYFDDDDAPTPRRPRKGAPIDHAEALDETHEAEGDDDVDGLSDDPDDFFDDESDDTDEGEADDE